MAWCGAAAWCRPRSRLNCWPHIGEAALRNTTLFMERDRVLGELRKDNVEVILLKGAALAETVYDNIALRPMGDIDLLVRPGDVSAVMRRLADAGYHTPLYLEPRRRMPVEYDNEIAVFKPGDARYRFDVHWGLLAALYYQDKMPPDWFWLTSQPLDEIGVPARSLGPEAQVLHLTAHWMLSHHGRGLRWGYDVGLVIWTYRRQIDWNLLCERALGAYDLVLPVQRVVLERAWWSNGAPRSRSLQLIKSALCHPRRVNGRWLPG